MGGGGKIWSFFLLLFFPMFETFFIANFISLLFPICCFPCYSGNSLSVPSFPYLLHFWFFKKCYPNILVGVNNQLREYIRPNFVQALHCALYFLVYEWNIRKYSAYNSLASLLHSWKKCILILYRLFVLRLKPLTLKTVFGTFPYYQEISLVWWSFKRISVGIMFCMASLFSLKCYY